MGYSRRQHSATHSHRRRLIAHLLAISDPSYFTTDSTNASFFVQAARELGYYGYDTRPFKKYLSINPAKATCIA